MSIDCPDDLPPPYRAPPDRDDHLFPVPTYQHRPVTREQLLEAIAKSSALVDCGAQRNPEAA